VVGSPGQLTILKPFFPLIGLKSSRDESITRNPYTIHAILNHSNPQEDQIFEKRKSDFIAELKRKSLNPQPPIKRKYP
jgi:hypothetical protein